MNQILSIKSAAILLAATAAMCFGSQEASAQCGYGGGRGFGGYGSGISISTNPYRGGGINFGYSSGYRGINYGGFNSGISVGVYRPPVQRYQNFSNFNYQSGRIAPYGNQFNYAPNHRSRHRGGHRHH